MTSSTVPRDVTSADAVATAAAVVHTACECESSYVYRFVVFVVVLMFSGLIR